jgi:hypothetical protein
MATKVILIQKPLCPNDFRLGDSQRDSGSDRSEESHANEPVLDLQKPFAKLLFKASHPKEADQIIQQDQTDGEEDD